MENEVKGSKLKKVLSTAVVFALAGFFYLQDNPGAVSGSVADTSGNSAVDAGAVDDSAITHAYENQLSDVQVRGTGKVSRLLRDDNEGSRHQKFILRLPSGVQILVAHNIDLAPRIDALQGGDEVEFFGEYEWNEKGGVVHWTHHDPGGRHVGGWLKHNGRTYE